MKSRVNFKRLGFSELGLSALDRRNLKLSLSPVRLLQAGVIAVLYLSLYGPLLPDLAQEWYEHENFTYAFLVPFIVLYLVWEDSAALRRIPVRGTPWGALTLLTALMVGLIGKVIGDVFTMRVSMVLAVAGLVHLFLGTPYLKALKFPLAYLFLLVPPPYIIIKQLSYYLRMVDAVIAAHALEIVGVPIYRDSYFLHLPNATLEVADVCSGIASLFAMLALSMIYAHFLPIRPSAKALVMASAAFFPILANLFRIFLVSVSVYYYGPIMLRAFFHHFTGTFTFLLSLAMVVAFGEFLRRRAVRQSPKAARSTPAAAVLEETRTEGRSSLRPVFTRGFLLAVVIFVSVIYLSRSVEPHRAVPLRSDLDTLPAQLGAYVLSDKEIEDPYEDRYAQNSVLRAYERSGGEPVELFIGYRGYQRAQDRLLSPKLNLLPAWNFVWVRLDRLRVPGPDPVEANWMLLQKGEVKRLVLYWYQVRGQSFAGEIRHRVNQVRSLFLTGRTDGAVIRIATPIGEGEILEQSKERLRDFFAVLYPNLARILPQ